MYFVYILQSQKDKTYYYGSTSDLGSRLKYHNAGKVKYTKGHRPYILHYFEQFGSRSEAVQRERFFKTISGYNWIKKEKLI